MDDIITDPNEVQCDFCGEWIAENEAKEAGWIFHYFADEEHHVEISAAVCDICQDLSLEQGDDNEYHYRED